MLKKIENTVRTKDVEWDGEVVASVRGLAPADLARLLTIAGEDLAGVMGVAEELDKMTASTPNIGAEAVADQLLASWPRLVSVVGEHLPNFIAHLIATAADAPDEWTVVRDDYSLVLQFEILVEIAKLTFNSPEGFRRFVGNVQALVGLSGTLTGAGKKPNSTRGARPSLAAG